MPLQTINLSFYQHNERQADVYDDEGCPIGQAELYGWDVNIDQEFIVENDDNTLSTYKLTKVYSTIHNDYVRGCFIDAEAELVK